MHAPDRTPPKLSRYLTTSALCAVASAVPVNTSAEDRAVSPAEVSRSGTGSGTHAPLEYHPTTLGTQFETANMLPAGAFAFTLGSAQTDPSTAAGTGLQIYFIGGAYAVNDRLTFGIDAQTFEDPVVKPIMGVFPTFGLDGVAGWVKYQAFDGPQLDIAVEGSAEFFRLDTAVFGTATGTNAEHVIGSIRAPFTFDFSDTVQGHVTPGVSFFPDEINGIPFYGTVGYVGAGLSFKPSERVAAYAAVNMPVSGGNAVTSAGAIDDTPVWTVGGRFNVTPKTALDIYATNGLGATPATSIMTLWPGGDQVLVGARLTVTPGRGPGYRPSYRGLRELGARERSLQQDGFTLTSPDTHEPGSLAATAWYGSDDNYGGGLILALEQDLQFEGYLENNADDGSVPAGLLPTTDLRYMLGGKLRFLDQNNGDPFTLSARVLGGRNATSGAVGPGALFVELPAGVKVNDRVALAATPKLAAFGNTEIYGLGLGVNVEMTDGLELIGEVTPTDGGNGTVWAAGLRYGIPGTGLSLDAHATNAVGRQGLGTLVAQDSVKYAIGITKTFDLRGWR